MQQLGSGMEEVEKVPGKWGKTKQMETLQRVENTKWTAERRW